MWKMTPSKSETVWSIETGGALEKGGLLGLHVILNRQDHRDTYPENRSVKTDWISTFW